MFGISDSPQVALSLSFASKSISPFASKSIMAITVKMAICVNYARTVEKGKAKKVTGKRSGLKRSAKKALVVRKNMAIKGKMHKCVNYRKCGRQAKGPYARFCTRCFVANAKLKGSGSFGNSSGNP